MYDFGSRRRYCLTFQICDFRFLFSTTYNAKSVKSCCSDDNTIFVELDSLLHGWGNEKSQSSQPIPDRLRTICSGLCLLFRLLLINRSPCPRDSETVITSGSAFRQAATRSQSRKEMERGGKGTGHRSNSAAKLCTRAEQSRDMLVTPREV